MRTFYFFFENYLSDEEEKLRGLLVMVVMVKHFCGNVMFSQASVILFTGGGVYPNMHWSRHPPPGQTTPPRPLTAVDGTHPIGMHSCSWIYFQFDVK